MKKYSKPKSVIMICVGIHGYQKEKLVKYNLNTSLLIRDLLDTYLDTLSD